MSRFVRRHRPMLAALAVVGVLAAALAVALPRLIAHQLTTALTTMGARQATVADVDFNPFTGRLAVTGLEFSDLHGARARVPRFELDVAWLPLLQRRLFLQRLAAQGSRLSVTLPAEPQAAPEGTAVGALLDLLDTLAAADWGVAGGQLDLRDLELTLRRGDAESLLVLQRLALRQLDSRLERVPVILEAEGSLDGAALLLRAAVTERDGQRVLEATLETAGLDLARLARLAGPGPLAAARLDGRWSLRLARPEPQRLAIAGDGELKLSGLRLALGAGGLEVEAASWHGAVGAELTSAAPGPMTGDGRLAVTAAGVSGVPQAPALALDGIEWRGRIVLQPRGTDLDLQHRGTLALAGAEVGEGGSLLALAGLRSEGDGHWSVAAAGTTGGFEGNVVIDTISGAAAGNAGEASDGRWRGRLELAADGAVTSAFRLSVAAAEASGPELEATLAGLSWDGELDLAPGDRLAADGQLAGGDLTARQAGRAIAAADIRWQGRAEAALDGDTPRPLMDGTLEVASLRLADDAGGLAAVLGDATLRGPLRPLAAGDEALFTGAVTVGAASVERMVDTTPLAAMAALELTGVSLTLPPAFAIDRGTATGLELLPAAEIKDRPLLRLDRLELSSARSAGDHHLALGGLRLTGLGMELERHEDGSLRGVDVLGALPAGATATPGAVPAAPAAPLTVSVEHFALAGPSTLTFTDLATRPAFRTTATIDRLELRDLDSRADTPPARLDLAATIDKYTAVALAGTVDLVGSEPTLDVEGEVKSLDLARLSTYTAKALGYTMTSGQLDADIDLELAGGTLDSANRLDIHKLEVEPLDPETMAALQAELTIPLEKALDMLRDGDDNISLELPVTGELANPRFDLSDAINQAIGSAVKAGAVSTLALALQPFGTLIAIAQMAGEAGSSVVLDPVTFAAGEARWQGEAEAYAARLAKLLEDRPEVRLKLCGVAVTADREAILTAAEAQQKETARQEKNGTDKQDAPPAPESQGTPALAPSELEERLLALARQRAEKVKDHLIATHRSDAARLFICNPVIDREADGAPRVEVGI